MSWSSLLQDRKGTVRVELTTSWLTANRSTFWALCPWKPSWSVYSNISHGPRLSWWLLSEIVEPGSCVWVECMRNYFTPLEWEDTNIGIFIKLDSRCFCLRPYCIPKRIFMMWLSISLLTIIGQQMRMDYNPSMNAAEVVLTYSCQQPMLFCEAGNGSLKLTYSCQFAHRSITP